MNQTKRTFSVRLPRQLVSSLAVNACFGRDWLFLPLYGPSPQLLAHSGQSKTITVRSTTFCNRFNCNVGPSAALALEDVAKMRVLGVIGRFCHYIAHRHNCGCIQADPRQPQSVVLRTFCNRLNCKISPSAILALDDLAKMRVLGEIRHFCHCIAHCNSCGCIQANPR